MKSPIAYKLASRTAKFFWKKNIITTLCAAIVVGIIVGTAILNDSIGKSMQDQTSTRLGRIVSCLAAPNDFRVDLATDIAIGQEKVNKRQAITKRHFFQDFGRKSDMQSSISPRVVAVLRYNLALQSITDGQNNQTSKPIPCTRSATLWGIDDNFVQLEQGSESDNDSRRSLNSPIPPGEATINETTANQWNIQQGDTITVTIDNSGPIPHNVPWSKKSNLTLSVSVVVTHIAPDDSIASLAINASQKTARNVFVNLEWLQEKLNMEGRANTLFADCNITYNYHPVLDDYGFQLQISDLGYWSVSSRKMFFSEQERGALFNRIDNIYGRGNVEIYNSIIAMVNEISIERPVKSTGLDQVSYVFLAATDDQHVPFITPGQVAITQWLAHQMDIRIGDTVHLQYLVPDPVTGKLIPQTHEWQVSTILAEDTLYNDRLWIPHIPGVTDKSAIHSWDAAFVSDSYPITPEDENHWSTYGAIPQIYINLEEAKGLFSNQHGSITSVRVWSKTLPKSSDLSPLPQEVGWTFVPIRQRHLQSSVGAYDFFVFFLLVNLAPIVCTVTMMVLFMRLNLAYRCKSIGLLQAIGWETSTIRRAFIYENAIISTVGAIIGIVIGTGMAGIGLVALNQFGQEIIGIPFLHFHISIFDLLLSAIVGWGVIFIASIFCIRRINSIRSIQRLRGQFYQKQYYNPRRSSNHKNIAARIIFLLLIALLVGIAPFLSLLGTQFVRIWTPTVLLTIGVLTLIVGLQAYYFRLTSIRTSKLNHNFHDEVRQPKQSVIIMGVTATMLFLIPALSVFLIHVDNCEQQTIRDNGGYSMVLKTSIPIYENINTQFGREKLGFSSQNQEALKRVNIDYGLIRDGDDASLSNLYYPCSPKIIGVSSRMLNNPVFAWRSAFIPTLPWEALTKKEYAYPLVQKQEIQQEFQTKDSDVIAIMTKQAMLTHVLPFVVDYNTIKNRYHLKGLDSRLILDDRPGREVLGRVVAVLDNDLFHGCLVTDEENMRQFFPEINGYRIFFVDCPAEEMEQVQKALLDGLALYGPEIETCSESRGQQAVVYNGWIHLTQVWLLLGFMLCSCGFYPILKRNIIVRKSELATLFTIGMTTAQVRKQASNGLLRSHYSGMKMGSFIAICAIVPVTIFYHSLDTSQLIWTGTLWIVSIVGAITISHIACRLATSELTENNLVKIIKERE